MSTVQNLVKKISDVMADRVSIQVGSYSEPVVYYDLRISQGLLEHHNFSFTWRIGDVVVDFKSQADFIKKYMGAKVVITLKDAARGENVNFKGVITGMEVLDNDGASKGFHIVGESPTVLLDDITQSETFLSMNLEEIGKKIDQNLVKGVLTGCDIKPVYTNMLPYIVQYNETDFGFLQRLATQYGEWMYYDGDYLKFGELKSSKASLFSGVNLHHFKVKSRLRSQKVAYKGYDYNGASEIGSSNLSPQNNTQSYIAQNAQNASGMVFDRSNTNHAFVSNAHESQDIKRMQEINQQAKEANVLTYSGQSKIPLQIGGVFSITKDGIQGDFIATKVEHYSKGFGHYECEFESIPRDVKVPPYTNPLVYPKAETQSAVVTDNNDPMGMGRIRFMFFWGHESDWTRLVTPHAGSGKGFYFIPEIGEEVFVSFEGGNPEKPFVVGTQYNGSEISGYNTAGNDQKVIHTRSGTKMIFNDAQGSIFIEDPSGNTWLMDGQGNISVNAPNNITMVAGKNITFSAGENIYNSAGINIASSAGKDMIDTAGVNINQMASNDFMLLAKNISKIASENYSYDAKDIHKNASDTIEVQAVSDYTLNSETQIHNQSGENVKNH
ncbi:contractile injection system protein, VgrG/Pvc8 family [Flavobacterium amniphilum]|uniref:type VI secretion system Vgr family protein n=1 Tax=Flavobacterium amniphilum TaxID=1834035 RepID=UPI002029E60D|nr:contractile injection system protein, VgrG/Pvc8 family [Flavobacterium amniphilum]MCL9805321.1 contractile injection system protein, VgrG/Pvc8 family [Flavobacterium amniphilum]